MDKLEALAKELQNQLWSHDVERQRVLGQMRETDDVRQLVKLAEKKRKIRVEAKGISQRLGDVDRELTDLNRIGRKQTIEAKGIPSKEGF